MRLFHSPFDSSLFNMRWYRLQVDEDTTPEEVAQAIQSSEADYVDVKLPSQLCHRERDLKRLGFRKTCVQVQLWRPVCHKTPQLQTPIAPETLIAGELPHHHLNDLATTCSQAFTRGRFHLDQHLPLPSVSAFMRQWIINSLTNTGILRFVLDTSFLTIKQPAAAEQFIDLIAVDPRQQGHGIGSKLISDALEYAGHQQADAIRVITETENPGAIRFYERHDFRIERFFVCLHLRRQDFVHL